MASGQAELVHPFFSIDCPSSISIRSPNKSLPLTRWHHVAGIWNQTAGGGSRIVKSGQLRDGNAWDRNGKDTFCFFGGRKNCVSQWICCEAQMFEAFEFHIKEQCMAMARNLGRHLVPHIWDHGKKFQASILASIIWTAKLLQFFLSKTASLLNLRF